MSNQVIHNHDIVIDYIVSHATSNAQIDKIVLFGSRARGDNHKRSDYDIAVFAPEMNHESWSVWKDKVIHKAPTLLSIDLILIDPNTSPLLRDNIIKEGKIIYVASKT